MKFLNKNTWYYLAASEWKSWHENTLVRLKKAADAGKTVVYIAGGSDIYQLLKAGIYNIVNIDPLYPSQEKYYSEGWDFLARGEGEDGGIGNLVKIETHRKLVMRRESYRQNGFVVQDKEILGKKISIPESTTTWSISDRYGKKLGSYTLLRRFVTQEDFVTSPGKVFTISFNELYFIMRTGPRSWGINPRKFSENLEFHVKQLRKPLTYPVLMNIREVQESANPHSFGSAVVTHKE